MGWTFGRGFYSGQGRIVDLNFVVITGRIAWIGRITQGRTFRLGNAIQLILEGVGLVSGSVIVVEQGLGAFTFKFALGLRPTHGAGVAFGDQLFTGSLAIGVAPHLGKGEPCRHQKHKDRAQWHNSLFFITEVPNVIIVGGAFGPQGYSIIRVGSAIKGTHTLHPSHGFFFPMG